MVLSFLSIGVKLLLITRSCKTVWCGKYHIKSNSANAYSKRNQKTQQNSQHGFSFRENFKVEVNFLCKEGKLDEALELFSVMDEHGFSTLPETYCFLLQCCTRKKALADGKRLHAHMIQTGCKLDLFEYSNLLNMYAKCGSLEDARRVFDKIPDPDMISWNALISGYAHHGSHKEVLREFCLMQKMGMVADQFSFCSVLSTCANLGDLEKGQQIHTHVIKCGFGSQIFVENALVDMYAKCGKIKAAHQLFCEIPKKDDVSWNVLVGGYAQSGHGEEALKLFREMQRMGFTVGKYSFGSVLKACGSAVLPEQGRQVHACIVKTAYVSSAHVATAILDMYGKCGRVEDAHQLFDGMTEKGEVLWNALIAGYAQNGYGTEVLKLFYQMQWAGPKASLFTFGSVLKACCNIKALEQGRQIHACIIKAGVESDVLVGSAIVDMYAKCVGIQDALAMFYKMSERNIVTWNTMIAGLCQTVYDETSSIKYDVEALNLFCKMQQADMKPNPFTVSSVLGACTKLASLSQGRQVHAHIIKNSFELDEFVVSALVDMYAKCGAIDDAYKCFVKVPKCDVVSWNAMVAGYAQNGEGENASRLFKQLLREGIEPDQATFNTILRVCATISAFEQGKQLHTCTIKTGFQPWIVVGNALVDMYAKCGSIEDAHKCFKEMPKQDTISWTLLISGYAQHGFGKEALQLFEQMQQNGVKPNEITFLSVLFACSHAGLVNDGCNYFDSMTKDHGILPRVDHCACIVDLLGRAGCLDEAELFIMKMKLKSDAVVWRALLSACKVHGNLVIGKRAAEHVLELEPHDASTYVLLSNIYTSVGKLNEATTLRNMMKGKGMKKDAGLSWIEISNKVHSFAARDRSHPQTESIYAELDRLSQRMKEAGYAPDKFFAMDDMGYG